MVVSLPGGADFDIRPQHYQRLTQKIAGKPEERILSYLMLRSLKQARYAAEPLGHFALAADAYTHFTSPIRRYPDFVVHRILKWALEHPEVRSRQRPAPAAAKGTREEAGAAAYRRIELEEIALEASEAERRADAAERELMDWKTAQFMEQHLGEEYEAIIITVVKFGFFVELVEIFVEGLVPITSLEEFTGKQCYYREADRAIVAETAGPGRRGPAPSSRPGGIRSGVWARQAGTTGPVSGLQWSPPDSRYRRPPKPEADRTDKASAARGQSFHLGDRVRVRADRIDPFQKRVEFALVSAASRAIPRRT